MLQEAIFRTPLSRSLLQDGSLGGVCRAKPLQDVCSEELYPVLWGVLTIIIVLSWILGSNLSKHSTSVASLARCPAPAKPPSTQTWYLPYLHAVSTLTGLGHLAMLVPGPPSPLSALKKGQQPMGVQSLLGQSTAARIRTGKNTSAGTLEVS